MTSGFHYLSDNVVDNPREKTGRGETVWATICGGPLLSSFVRSCFVFLFIDEDLSTMSLKLVIFAALLMCCAFEVNALTLSYP